MLFYLVDISDGWMRVMRHGKLVFFWVKFPSEILVYIACHLNFFFMDGIDV